MTEATESGRLEMRWTEVLGADGRTRMEAHWQLGGHATAPAAPAVHAA